MKKFATPEAVYKILKEGKGLPSFLYCTKNFRWEELLIHQTEIPSYQVLLNLYLTADRLQTYRNIYFNAPITITSGWRGKNYNKSIGGATNSYHIKGMALDFLVEGFSPSQVQGILDPIHYGGMELASGWTHIDTRPGQLIRFDKNNKIIRKVVF